MASRKTGKKKDDYSDETTEELLKKAKSLIRTDFGGSSAPEAVIKKKLAAEGIDAGPKTCAAVKKLLEEGAESNRRRIFPRIDEAIRRASGKTPVEQAP